MPSKQPVSLVTRRPVRIRQQATIGASGEALLLTEKQSKNTESVGKGRGVTAPPLKRGAYTPPTAINTGAFEEKKENENSTRCARATDGVASLDPIRSISLQEVERLAESLSPLERKKLLDKLAYQTISVKNDHDRDIAMWSQAVHQGLLATLGGLDQSAYGLVQVKRLLGLTKNWRPVADLAEALGLFKLPVGERQYAYHVLADILMKYAHSSATRNKAALSLNYLVNCCQSVAAAFDSAFPGYLAGGVGPLLFNMARKAMMARDQARSA